MTLLVGYFDGRLSFVGRLAQEVDSHLEFLSCKTGIYTSTIVSIKLLTFCSKNRTPCFRKEGNLIIRFYCHVTGVTKNITLAFRNSIKQPCCNCSNNYLCESIILQSREVWKYYIKYKYFSVNSILRDSEIKTSWSLEVRLSNVKQHFTLPRITVIINYYKYLR